MNACAQFEERLIDSAAGDLAAEQRPALDSHLAACAACRERFALETSLFASVDAGLAAMVAADPSAEFAGRVMEQVTGEAERKLLAAIDAGVARTVTDEPSPQFAAAVRTRIAQEPPPKASWFPFGWRVLVAGALAGFALLAFWPRPEPNVAVVKNTPPPAVPQVIDAGPPLQTAVPRVRPVRHAAPPVRKSEFEVLVPENERLAVTRFYRFVQEGRIDTAQVLEANRMELAARLGELKMPAVFAASAPVKALDLVDAPRSTSDER